MKQIMLDIETWHADKKAIDRGAHQYAEGCRILMIAWCEIGSNAVKQYDLSRPSAAREAEVKRMLTDPQILKIAHNANFEIAVLEHWMGVTFDRTQWLDSMALAKYLGLPSKLADLAPALGLPADEQKDKDGKRLMAIFSWDRKAKKGEAANAEGKHHTAPDDEREEYERYMSYNRQDVVAQIACYNAMRQIYTPPAWEQDVWALDSRINEAGVMVDKPLAEAVLARKAIDDEVLGAQFREIVGCRPTQTQKVRAWLIARTGLDIPNLQQQTREILEERDDLPDDVMTALDIYETVGGTANAKYHAMVDNLCSDERSRDNLRYYGAETGRWASQMLQLQNFYRGTVDDLDELREAAKMGAYDVIEMVWGPCLQMFKPVCRTALVAAPGCQLVDCDFNSIEARIAAWVCGAKWKMDAFRAGEDVYLATAKQMYGLTDCDKHTMSPDGRTTYRSMGKVAELAGGYGGGWKAYSRMDRTRTLTEDQLKDICSRWRQANRPICNYWYELQDAVVRAVTQGTYYQGPAGIRMERRGDALWIWLPSGRPIVYQHMTAVYTGEYYGGRAKYELEYSSPKGYRKRTYGAMIWENIVQGIARDCLAQAMLKIDAAGYRIVMHIHDEVVVEVPTERADEAQKTIGQIMSTTPDWAAGLPLKGEGWIGPYFRKG